MAEESAGLLCESSSQRNGRPRRGEVADDHLDQGAMPRYFWGIDMRPQLERPNGWGRPEPFLKGAVL